MACLRLWIEMIYLLLVFERRRSTTGWQAARLPDFTNFFFQLPTAINHFRFRALSSNLGAADLAFLAGGK